MSKRLIAGFACVVAAYLLLADIGPSVDDSAPVAAASGQGADADARLAGTAAGGASTRSDTPANDNDSKPSNPNNSAAAFANASATMPPSATQVDPPGVARSTSADHAGASGQTAVLLRLADHNMARVYDVLWQILDLEDLADDAGFRDFVLVTLQQQGVHAPGEVLAALIQNAPNPELRRSALRLLVEASQELSLDAFNQALRDQDPRVRQSAMAFFEEVNSRALLAAVTGAVLDDHREVRLAALSTLEEMYEYAPVWDVADLVSDDPDPQIRMRALELLTYGDREWAIDRLALALGDPDPRVSELAGALLAELESGST